MRVLELEPPSGRQTGAGSSGEWSLSNRPTPSAEITLRKGPLERSMCFLGVHKRRLQPPLHWFPGRLSACQGLSMAPMMRLAEGRVGWLGAPGAATRVLFVIEAPRNFYSPRFKKSPCRGNPPEAQPQQGALPEAQQKNRNPPKVH